MIRYITRTTERSTETCHNSTPGTGILIPKMNIFDRIVQFIRVEKIGQSIDIFTTRLWNFEIEQSIQRSTNRNNKNIFQSLYHLTMMQIIIFGGILMMIDAPTFGIKMSPQTATGQTNLLCFYNSAQKWHSHAHNQVENKQSPLYPNKTREIPK